MSIAHEKQRSCPGVSFGGGSGAAAPPIEKGSDDPVSSGFLSSFFEPAMRLLLRLLIFPESDADAAFVFSFIALISSAALVFSFIELMSNPMEKRPRNELPLEPSTSSGFGTSFGGPVALSSCSHAR